MTGYRKVTSYGGITVYRQVRARTTSGTDYGTAVHCEGSTRSASSS
jgi:hypothetical protein